MLPKARAALAAADEAAETAPAGWRSLAGGRSVMFISRAAAPFAVAARASVLAVKPDVPTIPLELFWRARHAAGGGARRRAGQAHLAGKQLAHARPGVARSRRGIAESSGSPTPSVLPGGRRSAKLVASTRRTSRPPATEAIVSKLAVGVFFAFSRCRRQSC